jgi:hypothetical protein
MSKANPKVRGNTALSERLWAQIDEMRLINVNGLQSLKNPRGEAV